MTLENSLKKDVLSHVVKKNVCQIKSSTFSKILIFLKILSLNLCKTNYDERFLKFFLVI